MQRNDERHRKSLHAIRNRSLGRSSSISKLKSRTEWRCQKGRDGSSGEGLTGAVQGYYRRQDVIPGKPPLTRRAAKTFVVTATICYSRVCFRAVLPMMPGLDHKASLSRLLVDPGARCHDSSVRPLRILYSKDHRVGSAMAMTQPLAIQLRRLLVVAKRSNLTMRPSPWPLARAYRAMHPSSEECLK